MANDKKKKPNPSAPPKPKAERKILTAEEKVAFWKKAHADNAARREKNAELSAADRTKRKGEKIAKAAAAAAKAKPAPAPAKPAPAPAKPAPAFSKPTTGPTPFATNPLADAAKTK
jgi:hypothetical protein